MPEVLDHAAVVGRLKEFLEATFPNPGVQLTSSTPLLNDWFLDSIGIIETVLHLETEFGIPVSRADINAANFRDLDALATLVVGRLAA
jgi:acyl carrier protein